MLWNLKYVKNLHVFQWQFLLMILRDLTSCYVFLFYIHKQQQLDALHTSNLTFIEKGIKQQSSCEVEEEKFCFLVPFFFTEIQTLLI
jgi:hypothetical protein